MHIKVIPIPRGTEPRPHRGRWSLALLRILASAWLVQVAAQVVLAADFIGGDIGAFHAHSRNGSLLALLPMLMTAFALVHAVTARRWWPAPICLVMFLVTVIQIGLGHGRVIGSHIVLGAALLTLSMLLAIALWRTGRES